MVKLKLPKRVNSGAKGAAIGGGVGALVGSKTAAVCAAAGAFVGTKLSEKIDAKDYRQRLENYRQLTGEKN